MTLFVIHENTIELCILVAVPQSVYGFATSVYGITERA
jgi:hypothetical protein